ncbi:MAG: hypothetical protein E7368_01010 [Clostridiales bacterium]|nr:hypothetical protein [Clostridiales bacterium]
MKGKKLAKILLLVGVASCLSFATMACGEDGNGGAGGGTNVENTPTKLGKVVLSVDENGLATWEAVEGATEYEYTLDGGATFVRTTKCAVQLEEGQKIKVRTAGDGVNTRHGNWSEELGFGESSGGGNEDDPNEGGGEVTSLETPVVTIDHTTGIASWEAVEGATEYVYAFVYGTNIQPAGSTTETSIKIPDIYGEIAVFAKNGDVESGWSVKKTWDKTQYNPGGNEQEKPALSNVVVSITDNIARWDAVANASGYIYSYDGGTTTFETTKTVLSLDYNQSLQVKAKGNATYADSEAWSNVVKNDTCDVLHRCEQVNFGTTGELFNAGGTDATHSTVFKSTENVIVGDYSVRVEAGNGTWIVPYLKVNGVEGENRITGVKPIREHMEKYEYLQVEIYNANDKDTALYMYETTTNPPVFTLKPGWNTVKLNRELVLSRIDMADENADYQEETGMVAPRWGLRQLDEWGGFYFYTTGTVYFDNFIGVYDKSPAEKLPAPQLTVNGNNVSWTANANASKYVYRLEVDGEDYHLEKRAEGNPITLTKSGKLYVKAVGDGANYLSSDYAVIDFTYVNVPTEVKTVLNRCEPPAGEQVAWYMTAQFGTITQDATYHTEGNSAFKLVTSADGYVCIMLRDASGNLTVDGLKEFDKLYFDIYNAGTEAVVLKFFDGATVVTTLQTGWNTVVIDKATIESQLAKDSSQFVSPEFRFVVPGGCTLYFDNVQGGKMQ